MNISRRLPSFALLACLGAVGSTGCGKDPGNGTVTVAYDWVLGSGCGTPFESSDQAVTEIRVTLTGGGNEINKTANCNEEDVVVTNVPQGSYNLLIEGLDAMGDTIADNINIPANADEKVSVSEGNSAFVDAELGPTPATVEVAVTVQVGGFPINDCSEADLQYFNVRASGPPIGLLHEQELDLCTLPSGFQPVPDMDRKINGLALNRIRIEVEDSSNSQLQELDFMLGGPVGAGKTVRIKVDCEEIDCVGTVSFPDGGAGGEESGGLIEETGGGESEGGSTGSADSTGGADTTGG